MSCIRSSNKKAEGWCEACQKLHLCVPVGGKRNRGALSRRLEDR